MGMGNGMPVSTVFGRSHIAELQQSLIFIAFHQIECKMGITQENAPPYFIYLAIYLYYIAFQKEFNKNFSEDRYICHEEIPFRKYAQNKNTFFVDVTKYFTRAIYIKH